MSKVVISSLLALLLVLAAGRPAFAVETIDWQGLVPPLDEALDPYTRLNDEQQGSLYDLWMIRETRKAGVESETLSNMETEAIDNLRAGGFDPETVLEELDVYFATVEENSQKMVDSLHGKDVRIPGYVLPTEFSGSKVIEFLLVPYVGACVHTPAPPANQLVHVKVDSGFTSEGLFEPVWVTGRMQVASSTQSVNFNDGAMQVESGYRILASEVVPYEPDQ